MRLVRCMRVPRTFSSSRYALGTIVHDIGRLSRPRSGSDLRLQNIATRFQSSVATTQGDVGKISIMDARGYGYLPVGVLPGQCDPQVPESVPQHRSRLQNTAAPLQPLSQTDTSTDTPLITYFPVGGEPSLRPLAPPKPPPRRTSPVRDKITTPSEESGGIPEPTPEYLQYASYPPLMLAYPRKILIVIDLNGTLLYRPDPRNPAKFIERPYTRTFLSYCIRTFAVAIWSSARIGNVLKMLKQILTPDLRSQIVAIWGRDKFGLSPGDYNKRVQCYKRLSLLWDTPKIATSHPDVADGGRWSQKDTVLVDDSIEKARSEPYNLLRIPEFEGDAFEPGFVLPQVHDYLNECSRQADVSTYIREVPFKLNPEFTL
ncbi:hypothetical protein F5X99DRAFT_394333 [Biscogniauxia marginata]|nr:hypothetical protein F5X99DRAFT_394333 [Biscogniauxia marginata]